MEMVMPDTNDNSFVQMGLITALPNLAEMKPMTSDHLELQDIERFIENHEKLMKFEF